LVTSFGPITEKMVLFVLFSEVDLDCKNVLNEALPLLIKWVQEMSQLDQSDQTSMETNIMKTLIHIVLKYLETRLF
jgi:hypothetical protein